MIVHMKRLALGAVAAAVVWAGPAYAQGNPASDAQSASGAPLPPPSPDHGGPHRGGPERRLEMLQQELSLTSDQTTQVRALFAAERTKSEAVRSNSALSADERRAQMMTIHQENETSLRALLTPDQVSRYDAMLARMRQHRPGAEPPQGAPPPPPPDSPGF